MEGACFWGALCDGGGFTLSPNVTVGAEDHGVHNVLANWTRQQVVSPGSRHGQRAWTDIQGVCKRGDAREKRVRLFPSENQAELASE